MTMVMTPEVKKEQVKNAKKLIPILQELGIKPFLWAGSLLGAVRNKSIIDWDSDMDIAYISKYDKAEDIIKEAIDLYKALNERELLEDYFTENFEKASPNVPIDSVFGQAHIGKISPYLDLFTMWIKGEDFYDPWFGPVAKNIDTTVVEDSVELDGVKFPALKNPVWVLEMLYGKDWGTPKKEKGTSHHYFRHCLKEFREGVV